MGNRDYTVNEILDRYARVRLPLLKARTRKDYARHIDHLKEHFGEKVAGQLRIDDFTTFMDVDTGRIQRNRMLAVLSAAFTEAIRWRWLDTNVCKEVQRHEAKPRERLLTDKEFEGAKKIAPIRTQRIMDLALLTGQLQGQIVNLRWDQVHDDVILFRHIKTGKKIEVPITPKLATVLDACGRQNAKRGRYVVPKRTGEPYTSEGFRACWQRVMNKWVHTGNDRFSFHDIRAKWARENRANGDDAHAQTLPLGDGLQIVCKPGVFRVPKSAAERDAVAVMMPFRAEFDSVYDAIRGACDDAGFQCRRASDIWEDTTIIQDIFNLIFRSHVVVVDFSRKNPNVMYETGIAHTLGRHVVPIAQALDDVPFDIKHHRVLEYQSNAEGLAELRARLTVRLKFIGE